MRLLQHITVTRRLGGLVTMAILTLLALGAGLSLSERSLLLQERQNGVRQTVEIAHGLIAHFHQQAAQGKISTEEAQARALQSLAALRYSGNEYFWVNDMHPRMIMHPVRPQLNGQDVSGNKDPTGRALFIDFVNIVKKDGAGFHSYLWPMPGSDEPVENISYVMGFQPWGWVVGSGVYIDTVNAAFLQRMIGAAAVSAALALLLVLLGWLISRSILRQLGDEPAALLAGTERMAQGDLSTPIAHRGDARSVAQGLEHMRTHLADIVQGVRHSAEHVTLASQEIAQGNHDLSGRTEEQASALEQTAASMEQVGSTVRQNADNARQANQLALNASQVAQQGGQVVQEVVTTMRGINSASQRIADIIGVIDGIAFQTNILALNAAVEAARAGEQGRGFAVVAAEVRSLAGRSAEAAKEIKTLITASVEQIAQGSALADRAGHTMADVVSAIRHVNDIVGEISAASAEQSAGVGQIAEAITQMDHNTQQNAALVEQSAAAANGLKMQAEQLLQAVSRFRLALQATQPDRAPAAVVAAPAGVRAAPTPRPVPAPRTTTATAAGAGSTATAAAARPARPRSAPPATSTTDNADWESF
ncbi:methyl-accepting chemotaxis protein [Comamonas aquatica]|uniref:Methyl-accepting chemotaxis protein n=1 Tax=Comamonas aquatica TaxID=225991 RepID=A0AA43AVQ3_9BURK|nr:methyl-accepting chemotaxis protein [Comamonas aquatica]MDH1430145.1 methyl-accepting chemotaxis protein [Comamonas aquatica]MDH1606819.1 methyl-accepting chemotaxis protein [Comamonas aquatica]MDH1618242.1 methyl-accepting chemotaxis protein [Comamonas aquatica]MDH1767575.1 methyl-accepting chemotaxis protein [Comamonas aquatica]MDH1814919.1 methyl-accepting chemotaxis protein [Comamonas aquatica]